MNVDIFNNLWSIIKTIQFRDVVDILAIALLVFGLLKLIRETRAVQLLKGLLLLLAVYILSSLFNLVMLSTLLRAFFEASVVIIAVIFQPEIRQALEQVGRTKNWKKYIRIFSDYGKNDEWEKAVKKGTVVDAATSVALFGNIFFNKAPLHDGASIIRDGKLFAAGCILPLTSNKYVDINLGTRHRAALGISEQSDAVVLVVSEETGVISLAVGGELTRDYTRETLIKKLNELLLDEKPEEEPKTRVFRKGRNNK